MAHLFSSITTSDFRGWAIIPLDNHDEFELTGNPESPVKVRRNLHGQADIVLLRDKNNSGDDLFLLLTNHDSKHKLRINGDPLYANFRLLRNRDEVMISSAGGSSQRLFFSSERKAVIDSFHESAHEVSCMRCHQRLFHGDSIVRCPSCGALHHESSDVLCWSYSSTCANGICSHTTDMNKEFRWIPDYLMRR